MLVNSSTVWIIMSKDRSLIAKGNVRDRQLIPTSDTNDIQRILTYTTKGRAEAAWKTSGFYNMELIDGYDSSKLLGEYLDAVEVNLQMVTVETDHTLVHTDTWQRMNIKQPSQGELIEVPHNKENKIGIYFPLAEDDSSYSRGKLFDPQDIYHVKPYYIRSIYWRPVDEMPDEY